MNYVCHRIRKDLKDLPPPWDACPPILAIPVRSALLIAAKPLLELPESELRPELLLLLFFTDLELNLLLNCYLLNF